MQEKKTQLIYGRHPVVDAIQNGMAMDKIMIQQGTRGDFEKEIRVLSKSFNIPLQFVPKERLTKMVRGNHQGIVGIVSLISYQLIEDILPLIYEKSEVPLLLLLDGITDVRNFGAIARSAACAGAHALIIPKKGGAAINSEAIKTSAGTLTTIPVCRESSLTKAVEYLQMNGIQVLASSLKGKRMLFELDLTIPTAIIMGAEGLGVHQNLIEKSDDLVIIPQQGGTDSYNVSVASGIILYEALRQRWAG